MLLFISAGGGEGEGGQQRVPGRGARHCPGRGDGGSLMGVNHQAPVARTRPPGVSAPRDAQTRRGAAPGAVPEGPGKTHRRPRGGGCQLRPARRGQGRQSWPLSRPVPARCQPAPRSPRAVRAASAPPGRGAGRRGLVPVPSLPGPGQPLLQRSAVEETPRPSSLPALERGLPAQSRPLSPAQGRSLCSGPGSLRAPSTPCSRDPAPTAPPPGTGTRPALASGPGKAWGRSAPRPRRPPRPL